jgi:hypothetical protein
MTCKAIGIVADGQMNAVKSGCLRPLATSRNGRKTLASTGKISMLQPETARFGRLDTMSG